MTRLFTQVDLRSALDDYRTALAEVVGVTTVWHEDLEAGGSPSSGQIAEYQLRVSALNEKAVQALSH
ncbi:hypothetical protein [Paraburkholderia unamae]|uniref:Uncharacterized protein n=1 Tax=Paraburkholderia unamae TaxID=219649 RepID=A0ACC6RMR7_9BURK